MNLNFKEYGSGQPVIILHGLLGMLDNWHSFAKKLSQDYWVILVDQRNHGKSPHSEEFNYDILADDLYDFMETNHIPKSHMIGHSMGGKTVLNFLNKYPEKVERTIIVDISPKAYSGGHEKIFEALLDLPLSEIATRKQAYDWLMKRVPEESTSNFLLKNLRREKGGEFNWKANIEVLRDSYENIKEEIFFSENIEHPSLFVQAGQSDYISDDDDTFIGRDFSNYKIVKIENAGHWVHVDEPEVLLNEVKRFLD